MSVGTEFCDVPQHHYRRSSSSPQGEQHREIGIGGNDDPFVGRGALEDLFIRSGKQSQLCNVSRVVSAVAKTPDQLRGQVRVEQESHAGRATGSSRSFTTAAAYSS